MDTSLDARLQAGIAAARAGQAEQARGLLLRVIEVDQHNLQAWYWLGRVVQSPQEREICLENVLALDPGHTAVLAELADLRHEMAQAEAVEAVAAAVPQTVAEEWISVGAVEPLACPHCGRPGDALARECPACRRELYTKKPKKQGHSIYSIGLVAIWFGLANWLWFGLAVRYVRSLVSARLAASPGVAGVLEALGELVGREGTGLAVDSPPLAPVLLAGGAAFIVSLVVAWGLYQRFRAFYWLCVGLVFLAPLVAVYQVISAETIPWRSLGFEGVFFVIFLALAFLSYEEFMWVEQRLSAALDRDVDSSSSLFARGREYANKGLWAKAAAHWSRAVALSPGHPEYRLSLASALIHLGQPERAEEHLRYAQQIEPDNPRIQELLEML